MPYDWERFSEAEYANEALQAACRYAGEVRERRGSYRSLVGAPWLEGPPPQLVMAVKDEDGGRYERRFNLRVGDQPPSVAKYLVEDAVARLPDALPAIPRSCEEAWQDLRALAWQKAPTLARATVRHRDAAPTSLAGRIAICRHEGGAGKVLIGDRHLFDFAPSEFSTAELWTADGDLFCLTLEFGWGSVELQDG